MNGDPKLYSIQEAATLLGISRTTLYQLLTSGELGSLKIGRRRCIARKSLDDFIKRAIERNSA